MLRGEGIGLEHLPLQPLRRSGQGQCPSRVATKHALGLQRAHLVGRQQCRSPPRLDTIAIAQPFSVAAGQQGANEAQHRLTRAHA